MALEGYTSNFPDPDLIPSNVRKDKEIFGVAGDFEGGVGTLGVGRSQYSIGGSVVSLPQYTFEISAYSILNNTFNVFMQEGDFVVICVGKEFRQGGGLGGYFVKINHVTGEFYSPIFVNQISEILYENGHLYTNFSTGNYDIDISARTISGPIEDAHTTGVTPSSTPITIGGKTFNISPIINSGSGTDNIRRANTGTDMRNWTGIIVS